MPNNNQKDKPTSLKIIYIEALSTKNKNQPIMLFAPFI